ncbi:sel1-repeat-containing protein ybeq [Anaeramoeba flamelloides]|uniref:Sel1-repeat-containing protein ybeq n=1 Tax=Anaeramoeba flamelloides TaxID=1746091 RepID=A0AAV7ZTE4_9EUKA|nr:sel1-repeat-containing protein ybeq [Anaeramoeba flamelloides]
MDFKDLKQKADQGDPLSIGYYGTFLYEGIEVEQNYTTAFEYFSKGAKLNDPMSIYHLGEFYNLGLVVEQNHNKAFHYFSLSSELNCAKALNRMGEYYFYGIATKKNVIKACNYWLQSEELGNTASENNLKYCFRDDPKKYKEDIDLLIEEAEKNNIIAINTLGFLYEFGNGVEENGKKAFQYYTKSGELNNPIGIRKVGVSYYRGIGCIKNYDRCFEYNMKSAKLGNSCAYNNLGIFYKCGQGCDVDLKESAKWFRLSVKSGNANGCNSFAYSFGRAEGVETDERYSVILFQTGHLIGNSFCTINLGYGYQHSHYYKEDCSKSLKYYKLTTLKDLKTDLGFYNVAICLENGTGTKKNLASAYDYFKIAESMGYQKANQSLEDNSKLQYIIFKQSKLGNEIQEVLYEGKLKLDNINVHKENVLHTLFYFTKKNLFENAKQLICLGVDINKKNNSDLSPFEILGFTKLRNLYLKYRDKIKFLDKDFSTYDENGNWNENDNKEVILEENVTDKKKGIVLEQQLYEEELYGNDETDDEDTDEDEDTDDDDDDDDEEMGPTEQMQKFVQKYKNVLKYLRTFNSYSEDFLQLLKNKEFSDRVFKKIKYHKLILETRIGMECEKIERILINETKNDLLDFFHWVYSGYLSRNEITIRNICEKLGIQQNDFYQKSATSGLIRDIKKLLHNDKSHDFTIVVNDENITVNKVILQARSGLFREMFRETNDNSNQVHDYSGKTYESMSKLLEFFYTDNLIVTADDDVNFLKEELQDSTIYYLLNEYSRFDYLHYNLHI